MSRYNGNLIATAIRKDATFGKLTTSEIGKHLAYQHGVDAWNVVEFLPPQLTATDADYLGGNDLKRHLVIPTGITELKGVMAPVFPNLAYVTIGDAASVVNGLDVGLADITVTVKVPNNMLSAYQAKYALSTNLTFVDWVFDVEYQIPYVGEGKLTIEHVALAYAQSSGDPTTVTKVVVPSSFTEYEPGVFDYIFLKFVNATEIKYFELRLPNAYQEVEYIESTGDQYIDTGLASTTTQTVNIVFAPLGGYQNGEKCVFGYWPSDPNQMARICFYYGAFYETGKFTYQYEGTLDVGTIVTAEANDLSNAGTGYYYYIFTQNVRNDHAEASMAAKLYSCVIKDNGVDVRNFVPCYRKSDNEIGLYDLVNGTFYTNSGTGTFAKGSDNDTLVTKTVLRPVLSTATIYYDSDTSHTLTSEIIQNTLTRVPEFSTAEKVIVPEWFTEYESGSINAIISAFEDMEVLTTTYSGGTIDLDMNGDVVAKIVSIGKTVDEALVYARTLSSITAGDTNLIIAPPLSPSGEVHFTNMANLVYVSQITINVDSGYDNFNALPNLVELKAIFSQKLTVWPTRIINGSMPSLKKVNLVFQQGSGESTGQSLIINSSVLNSVLATGFQYSLNVSSSTAFTSQALIDFINSLGTPSTQQTLTIGATNLAKLTAEDIAIATNKNWTVQ